MQRTLENCSLIKQAVNRGEDQPKQYYNINKCEGYRRGTNDDEPCEACKKCRFHITFE